ncbi:hypothetical protein ACLOJK_032743, partial [Asimina triloba]
MQRTLELNKNRNWRRFEAAENAFQSQREREREREESKKNRDGRLREEYGGGKGKVVRVSDALHSDLNTRFSDPKKPSFIRGRYVGEEWNNNLSAFLQSLKNQTGQQAEALLANSHLERTKTTMKTDEREDVIQAWYMDDCDEDQRLPHHRDPKRFVSLKQLEELGVLSWRLTADDFENDEELKKIRAARGYSYMDICEVCPEKLPNYEAKIKSFFEEHLHTDEEIRYCLEGSGYFDVRDKIDGWIRIAVKKGAMIVLPAGIYHRFTLDTDNYIKAFNMFTAQDNRSSFSGIKPQVGMKFDVVMIAADHLYCTLRDEYGVLRLKYDANEIDPEVLLQRKYDASEKQELVTTHNANIAMRLFVGEPVWTPYNRPRDDLPARKEYLENFVNKEAAGQAVET